VDIEAVQKKLEAFARERDWEQFHSPKNLAMALAGEAGELLELFQWLTQAESEEIDEDLRAAVAHELADVMIYLLRLADRLDIDLDKAVVAKMKINAEKYPVALARGKSTKSTRR
jgi:NTP pyrophosphatase (non-canonical NTP hydrolase)